MYLTQPPRYFPDGTEFKTRIDPTSLDLVRLTRLYFFRAQYEIEGGTYETLADLVIERLRQRIDTLLTTIDFQGIDEFTYSEQLTGLMVLIRANLDIIIAGLYGYRAELTLPENRTDPVKNTYFVGIQRDDYPEMSLAAIFGTNLRLFVQQCLRNTRIQELLADVIETQVFHGEEQFLLLMERFHAQLINFSYTEITGYDREDLYQRGLSVLQSCKEHYCGKDFIPLRWYFGRALGNGRITLIREGKTDKRKVRKLTVPCSFGIGESLPADFAVNAITAREWEATYYIGLHDDGEDTDGYPTRESSVQYFTIEPSGNKLKIINEVTLLIFKEICSQLEQRLGAQLEQYRKQIGGFGNLIPRGLIYQYLDEMYGASWNSADGMREFIRKYWRGRVKLIPMDIITSSGDEEIESDPYRVEVGEPDPELFDILLARGKEELNRPSSWF